MYLCARFNQVQICREIPRIGYTTARLASYCLLALCSCTFSFFMSHDVTSNVLWYFGQSLVYVATVFGFALTFDTRVKDIINKYFNNKNGTQD